VCTDYCALSTVHTIAFVSYTSIIIWKTAINKSVVFSEWKGALHSEHCTVNRAQGIISIWEYHRTIGNWVIYHGRNIRYKDQSVHFLLCPMHCTPCTVHPIVLVLYTSIIILTTAINKSVVFSQWKVHCTMHSPQWTVHRVQGNISIWE
jgi:hypothetical protein